MKKYFIVIPRQIVSLMLLLIFLYPAFSSISEVRGEINKPVGTVIVSQDTSIAKYALLVGISGYDRGSKKSNFDWWNLYAANDVELIADVLVRKFEYRPENIKILSDKPITVAGRIIPAVKPTKRLILDTFRSFLIAQAKPGDIVFFHFSGHGQAVSDDNGDEIDGRDETLVPIDYVSVKDGSRNIRDDEISVLLEELAAKKASAVIITIDSCFSGTSTRGEFRPRGGSWIDEKSSKPSFGKVDDDFGDYVSGSNTRGENDNRQYVFLSAAGPNQSAQQTWIDMPAEQAENNGKSNESRTPPQKREICYGIFSYALAKALEESGKNTTYRDLFERVTDYVSSKQRDQTPQLEGRQLDNIIFGEGALPPQNYVSVKFSQNGLPYLLAGKLQGMTKGSKFALYPAGAKEHENGKQIAIAEISSLDPTTSILKVEGNIALEKLKQTARAFEISHNYEDLLRVAIQENVTNVSGLNTLIENLGLAQKTSSADKTWNVLIRLPNAEDIKLKEISADFRGIVLQRADGSIIAKLADDEKKLELVRNALQSEAKWLTVKSLEDYTDPELNIIKLEIVPVDVEFNKEKEAEKITESSKPLSQRGGKIEISIDSFIQLKIHNIGKKEVYVTVLHLGSDGAISAAFPRRNKDNLIRAGSTFTVQYPFRITGPSGQESFRAIVTAEPTDFTPLIDSGQRGSFETRGVRNAFNSPLGKILRTAQTSKRSEIGSSPASWGIATATFFVVLADDK